jgi:hypothetical protein
MTMKTNKTEQFEDRVRFNWGYHDARFDIKHNRPNRETVTQPQPFGVNPLPWNDKPYCEGYIRGFESNINDEAHRYSQWAWDDYTS